MRTNCKKHGNNVRAYKSKRHKHGLRCALCQDDAVSRWRHARRNRLIKMAGSKCTRCGYSICNSVLEFHHLNPSTKEFSLSVRDMWRPWNVLVRELQKCTLLCANCHREIEVGMAEW